MGNFKNTKISRSGFTSLTELSKMNDSKRGGRKVYGTPTRGSRTMTSTAKKRVLNSTSNSSRENVMPSEWDASAIEPPVASATATTTKKIPPNLMNKTSFKPRTSIKTRGTPTTVRRGPLKSLPNQGHLSNSSMSSNSFLEQDESQALYDEYLLSTLMMVNVKENAKKQANKEVRQLWTSVDSMRTELLATQKSNLELKTLLHYQEEVSESNSQMKQVINAMKTVKIAAKEISNALEHTQHELPVEGAKVDNIEPLLSKRSLTSLAQNGQVNQEAKEQVTTLLQDLVTSLQLSRESAQECQKSLADLKSETLKETSRQLSQKAKTDIQEIADSMIVLPPEPKLIEF